jgi:hypothetical protein
MAGAQLLPLDLKTAPVAGWQWFWLLPAAGALAVLVLTAGIIPRENPDPGQNGAAGQGPRNSRI